MQSSQKSPLDQSPVYQRILDLIRAGEFNTTIAASVSQEYGLNVKEHAIRRFRKRHQINPNNQSTLTIKNDTAQFSEPIVGYHRQSDEAPVLDDPDQMLRARNLDPAQWYIDNVTVNEWDGPSQSGITRYYQARFTAKKKSAGLLPVRSEGWRPLKKPIHYSQTPELVVICGDQQAPFHDLGLHDAFLQWLRVNQPVRGVVLGDLVDFPDVSRHPADPDNVATVSECLQSGYEILRDYVAASPATEWQMLYGNHDIRVLRYIIDKSPLIQGLSRVKSQEHPEPEAVHTLTHLMRLDELGVELVQTNGAYEDAQITLSDKLAVRHGWHVRQGSGASALKTLTQTHYSIVVGHTHRQSIVYHTIHDINRQPTTLVAAEAGCMCRLDGRIDASGRRFPSYAVLPDWQNGFMTARIYADGKFHLTPAIYVNSTLLWENQRYQGNTDE